MTSAGLLVHRGLAPEVLIAHMGGPYWARKDEGAWSIPKGEYDPAEEDAAAAAEREFREELGVEPPPGPRVDLGEFRYSSGKRLAVYAVDGGGWEPGPFAYGEFEMEWPPRSGRRRAFPEVDRAEWVGLPAARTRLVKGQQPALDALERHLAVRG